MGYRVMILYSKTRWHLKACCWQKGIHVRKYWLSSQYLSFSGRLVHLWLSSQDVKNILVLFSEMILTNKTFKPGNIWKLQPTGNKEFQYYTNNRTNSYVKNGVLHLKPTLTNDIYGDDFLVSGELDLWGNSPGTVCTSNR